MHEETALLEFEARLGRALARVRRVLEAERAVRLPSERRHRYEDKYLLAEHLTRSAAAAQLSGLATLGPEASQVRTLQSWAAQRRPVILRFRSEERCSHLRTETRDVEGAQGTEVSVGGAVQALLSCRAVTKVTEHVWKFEVSYSLEARSGLGEDAPRLRLLQRSGSEELRSASEAPPRLNAIPAIDSEVDASWLFRQFQEDPQRAAFRVDRSRPECRTPRRNPDVGEAEEHFTRLERWANAAASYLDSLLKVQPGAGREAVLRAAQRRPLVLAATPLLLEEEDAARAEAAAETGSQEAFGALMRIEDTGGPLLGPDDSARLLREEMRLLREQQEGQCFPAGDAAVATAAETTAALAFRHCSEVCRQWRAALDYLEKLLRKQLAAAIGKELAPVDFAEYMAFHNRRLFEPAYAPKPFAYAVRRSEEHTPEGSLNIECEGADGVLAPISTLVAKAESPHPMHFALSASTSVRFGGQRFLHAWLDHKFSDQAGTKLTLAARARQFSSMMVLVGRIASATLFEPTFAAIVKDKDALSIPLQLSTIPTAKEFRDAVESLSPEQRAFAKAFRAMQLESTLFGVLVVQIKPQLEKVLNLPVDSLTKEIKLTQDLMKLFMDFQIPSDLLSFDAARAGSSDASTAERLEAVRGQVQGMQAVIEQAEREELESKRAEQLAAMAAASRGPSQERFRTMTTIGCDFNFRNRRPQVNASPPAPALPSAPSAPSTTAAAPEPRAQQQPRPPADAEPASGSAGALLDYTEVPRLLDQRAESLDSESALRPTIVSAGARWRRASQSGLLARPGTETLGPAEQKGLKDAAFDLLDALTKSGALALADAELHVVVAATHCFEKSLLETVVQDNVDPIERVERSTLILATTIHRQPAAAMLQPAQLPRARRSAPALFLQEEEGA